MNGGWHPKPHRTGSGHRALNTASIIAARLTERMNGMSNRREPRWSGELGIESSGTEGDVFGVVFRFLSTCICLYKRSCVHVSHLLDAFLRRDKSHSGRLVVVDLKY